MTTGIAVAAIGFGEHLPAIVWPALALIVGSMRLIKRSALSAPASVAEPIGSSSTQPKSCKTRTFVSSNGTTACDCAAGLVCASVDGTADYAHVPPRNGPGYAVRGLNQGGTLNSQDAMRRRLDASSFIHAGARRHLVASVKTEWTEAIREEETNEERVTLRPRCLECCQLTDSTPIMP